MQHLVDLQEKSEREMRGHVVSIAGNAGVGKTRLLTEFAAANRSPRTAFIRVRCGESAPVGAPLVSMLDELRSYRELSTSDEIASARQCLTALDRESGLEPVERLRRRFDAFAAAMVFAAKRLRRLTVVVEDLHAANPSTLAALRSIAVAVKLAPLLLVVTYRPDDVTADHGRAAAIAAIEREDADRITLEPLAYADLATLLGSVMPTASPAFLRRIYKLSEGVPYVAEELARNAIERGGTFDLGTLVTLRGSVLERVAQLKPQARHIIERAAILGRTFLATDVRAFGSPKVEVFDALRAAVDRQIIAEEMIAGDSWFRFRHALTREIVYENILAGERRELHRVIAERIASTETRKAELAYHMEAAAEYERAVVAYERGGDEGSRVAAFSDAADLYGRALDLTTDVAIVARLAPKRSLALRDAGRLDELLATNARDAERLARSERPDDALLLEMIAVDAVAMTRQHEASAILERANASVRPETARALRCELELLNAAYHHKQFRTAEALAACDRAEAAHPDMTLHERNHLAFARATAYVGADDIANALRVLDDRVPVDASDDVRFEAESCEARALIAHRTGDLRGSIDHWNASADVWDRARLARSARAARQRGAESAAEVGDFAYVERLVRERRDSSEDEAPGLIAARALLMRAIGGDPTPLVREFEQAARKRDMDLMQSLGRDLPWMLSGDKRLARAIVASVIGAFDGPSLRADFVGTVIVFGTDEDVARSLERYIAPPEGFIRRQASDASMRARLALRRNRSIEAVQHAKRAAQVASGVGLWLESAHALAIAGDLHGARVELLRVGANAELSRLEDGGAIPAASASGPVAKLTAREHQISRLVTSGLSSRETAARLGINFRTVETHVANLYQKLGITTRAELADRLRSA